MDNWNEISEFYKSILSNDNYAVLAQSMLDLVEQLRQLPEFKGVNTNTAHTTLTIGLAGVVRKVHVSWQSTGLYSIYMDHSKENFYGEETLVKSNDVIPTIKEYLNRLKVKE